MGRTRRAGENGREGTEGWDGRAGRRECGCVGIQGGIARAAACVTGPRLSRTAGTPAHRPRTTPERVPAWRGARAGVRGRGAGGRHGDAQGYPAPVDPRASWGPAAGSPGPRRGVDGPVCAPSGGVVGCGVWWVGARASRTTGAHARMSVPWQLASDVPLPAAPQPRAVPVAGKGASQDTSLRRPAIPRAAARAPTMEEFGEGESGRRPRQARGAARPRAPGGVVA